MTGPEHIEESSENNPSGTRLNKYVAHCGVASRRKASALIQAGEIAVNGQVVRSPGHRLDPDQDVVTYKGAVLTPEEKKVYLLLNKPRDVITTSSDERGRRTVLDLIKNVDLRIYPVGRLDRDTTGLLLLTNDGDLAKKLSHPRYRVRKIYHVLLDKAVTKKDLQAIASGLELEDGQAIVDKVSHVRSAARNEVGIEIHMGKNRIVRRIFEHLGYQVVRLDRVYYAGLTKKDLPRGRYRNLTEREVIMLKHFS